MSNFEKDFNSAGMKKWRFPILFAVLIIIGILGYHFQNLTIALVAAAIVIGIFFVEKNMGKRL